MKYTNTLNEFRSLKLWWWFEIFGNFENLISMNFKMIKSSTNFIQRSKRDCSVCQSIWMMNILKTKFKERISQTDLTPHTHSCAWIGQYYWLYYSSRISLNIDSINSKRVNQVRQRKRPMQWRMKFNCRTEMVNIIFLIKKRN